VPSSAQIIVQPPAIFKSLRLSLRSSARSEHVDRHDTGMVKPHFDTLDLKKTKALLAGLHD
jgi:hypothetical protein